MKGITTSHQENLNSLKNALRLRSTCTQSPDRHLMYNMVKSSFICESYLNSFNISSWWIFTTMKRLSKNNNTILEVPETVNTSFWSHPKSNWKFCGIHTSSNINSGAAKMQIALFCFSHISASEHLISKILAPITYTYLL